MSVVQQAKDFYSSGLMGKLFNFCKGRNTFFALVFTVAGIVLAFEGKLTAQYVALVGAIQTLVVAHSVKEDVHERFLAVSSPAATESYPASSKGFLAGKPGNRCGLDSPEVRQES